MMDGTRLRDLTPGEPAAVDSASAPVSADPLALLDQLSETLPHLDDAYKKVWVSRALPSAPVAMASFRSKGGEPLLAVACESGLLWVASAENPEVTTSLQAPGIGPGRDQVQALWASNALRLFGDWTELLLLVARDRGAGKEAEQVAYRALARQTVNGVELRAVTDDVGAASEHRDGEWISFPLPDDISDLDHPRIRFAAGFDPFAAVAGRTPLSEFRQLPPGTLVASSGESPVVVEGGCLLKGPLGEQEPPALYLEQWVRSAIAVDALDEKGRPVHRVIVLDDGRGLQGLELHGRNWGKSWEQTLSNLPLVIDSDTGASGGDWPDLFVGFDDRMVGRFKWLPPASPRRIWRQTVDQLAAAAGLGDPIAWMAWCRKHFDHFRGESTLEALRRRRTLHYLAVERALAASDAQECGELFHQVAGMLATEQDTDLLQSAAALLEKALREWEEDPSQGDAIPELVWACYEKTPFVIQELFDSHLRGVSREKTERLSALNHGYKELVDNSRNVLASFTRPKERLRDAGINVIRYMDRYATASFTPAIRGFGLRHLQHLTCGGESYVAAVGVRKLRLYHLDDQELQEEERARTDLGLHFAVQFVRVVSLSEGRPALLMGTRQGKLSVWDPFRAGSSSPAHESFQLGGILMDAASLPGPGKATEATRMLVATVADRRASLVRIRLDAQGRVRPEASFHLGLRWVETMACYAWEGSDRVLVGDGNDLVLLGGDLANPNGGDLKVLGRRSLPSTIKSVAVLAPGNKTPLAFVGLRDGAVVCLALDPHVHSWQRVRWVYQVRRGVASLELSEDGRQVTILTTAGEVLQLTPEGGQIYKYRPSDAAVAATLLPPVAKGGTRLLVVGAESGKMIVLQENPKPRESLKQAEASLTDLERAPLPGELRVEAEPPNNEAGELGWLLAHFQKKKRDPLELYQKVHFRVSRHALACLLGRHPHRVRGKEQELITALTLRDLARFLRELDKDRAPSWLREAFPRLVRFKADEKEDQGIGAASAVLYELSRISRESAIPLALEQLRSLPGNVFESEWIAQVVAHAVVQHSGRREDKPEELLESLLVDLSGFPLQIAHFAASFAGASVRSKILVTALLALGRLGEAVERGSSQERSAEVGVALVELAAALRPWQAHPGEVGFLARYLGLLVSRKRNEQDSRRPWLQMMEVVKEAQAKSRDSDLFRFLRRPVGSWLKSRQVDMRADLASREEVLREVRDRVDKLDQDARDAVFDEEIGTSPWQQLFNELTQRGRQLLRQLSQEEKDHLSSRVWILDVPEGFRRLRTSRVAFEVMVRPQSLRRFRGVKYRLEVGLDGVEAVEDEWAVVDPVLKATPRRISFKGVLKPDQSKIALRSRLQWEGKSEPSVFEFQWDVPPLKLRTHQDDKLYSEAFATQAKSVVQQLKAFEFGCLLVLLDNALGRTGIVQEMEEAGVRVVDLDAALADLGPGRTYPGLLRLPKILEALAGETLNAQTAPLGTWKKIIMSQCDDLWRRLLTTPELAGVSQELMRFLAERRNARPPLILMIDGKLGSRLFQELTGKITALVPNRLPAASQDETVSMWNEAAIWLGDGIHAEVSPEAATKALALLGGDLRLGLLLRRTARDNPLAAQQLGELAAQLLRDPEAQEILQAELHGLSPRAIQLLIVAACATVSMSFTQLSEGLIAAEDVYSTRRDRKSRGKLLLSEGETIKRDHIQRQLRSDRESASRFLQVEGYWRSGSNKMPATIAHLAQFLGNESQVQEAAQELAKRHAVVVTAGVVRALPPFRALIRAAVSRAQNATRVYSQLTGAPSLLHGLRLADFSRLTPELLREVDQRVKHAQALMLTRLGKVWHALDEEKSFPVRELQLAIEALTDMKAELEPSSSENVSGREQAASGERYLLRLSPEKPPKGRSYYLALYGRPAAGEALPRPAPELLARIASEARRDECFERLLVVRQGPALELTSAETWFEISENELRDIAVSSSWHLAFWAMVRTRAGQNLAPFRDSGALPPGSPLFFGREKEQSYILNNVRDQSFLIVGSRQVGKTSLINQLRFRLKERGDLKLYYIDIQGNMHREELMGQLRKLSESDPATSAADAGQLFSCLVDQASREGKLAVFMLNELDYLIQGDPTFLNHLRSLHETNQARFIMVGYTRYAAAACHDPRSALYSWTNASGGQKYMTLAELSYEAARQIVDLLEQPPLFLSWEPEEHKERAIALLLDCTYRIPFLVQRLCKQLVERLEQLGRYRLRIDDVETLARGNLLADLGLHEGLDPKSLVPGLPESVGHDFVLLLLASAIKNLYFKGNPPAINDPELPHREARSLSFDSADLSSWLLEIFRENLLPRELAEAERTLHEIHLDQILFGLTLTLILSTDPYPRRYYFQLHLYPKELNRMMAPGESIDDQILKLLLSFARHISLSNSAEANA